MNTTIQINGKIYDIKTGKVIASNQASVNETPVSHHANPISTANTGVVMDGIIATKTVKHHADVHNHIPAHDVKLVPQKSQTLHRKAVQKPAPKTHIHSTSANVHSKVEQSATGRGMLLKRVPDSRLRRAMTSPKSNLIAKFNSPKKSNTTITSNLPVAQAPTSQVHSNVHFAPPISKSTNKPTMGKSSKKYVFEDQIKNANSHLLQPVKKEKSPKKYLKSIKFTPKALSMTAAIFAFIALGGFLAYQNIPSVSMRVAANQAGFMGKMPQSVPSGYSFAGPVAAAEGSLALTYESNSDDRKFIMVQKPTNWSSESLLTNYLIDSKYRYQAYKDNGLTVYIYNGSSATWVDKGIWYNVSSNDDSLSAGQLLELASSI